MHPEITVIVTAFHRREFFLQALDSAMVSGFDPHRHEVLLVKNFDDPAIDIELPDRAMSSLSLRDGSIGEWMVRAAACARGDVLVFLDDDDLFEPGKLPRIIEVFGANPGLAYYHNAIRGFVDPSSPPSTTVPKYLARAYGTGPGLIVSPRRHGELVGRLWKAGGAYSTSAVALRRSFLLEQRPWLERIEAGPSTLLYFAAASLDRNMFLDDRVLTRYRIHSSNTSGAPGLPRGVLWQRTTQYAPRLAHDAELVLDMIRSNAGTLPVPVLEEALARTLLLAAVGDPSQTRPVLLRAMLRYLGRATASELRVQWGVLALSGLSVLSRSLAGRAIGSPPVVR